MILRDIKQNFDMNFGVDYEQKWNRYVGTYAPIKYKTSVSELKKDSQMNISSNFMSEIVNLKTGYLASKIYENIKTEDETLIESFKEFQSKNSENVMNIESTKSSSACGISHRLFYWKDGMPIIKNIPAWQVIYDYDDDIFTPKTAYYYFSKTDLLGNTEYFCDVYDSTYVTHFQSKSKTSKGLKSISVGNYFQVGEPEAHLSNQVPIIPFLNNDTIQGNCDKVLDLIDAYDEVTSDFASEIKASRFAYLKIFGDLYTGTDSEGNPIDIPNYLREFGTLLFPQDENGKPLGDAQFLEKNINFESIKSLQDVLKKHIFEQSDSVDISEIIAMGSNSRIFTVKTALMRLETDCSLTERFIKKALEKQFDLFINWYTSYYDTDVLGELNIEFNRSFPEDIESVVTALNGLKQSLALEDALNYMGFENAKTLAENHRQEFGLTQGL